MTQEAVREQTTLPVTNLDELLNVVALGLRVATEAELLQQPGVIAACSLEGKNVCGFAGLQVKNLNT